MAIPTQHVLGPTQGVRSSLLHTYALVVSCRVVSCGRVYSAGERSRTLPSRGSHGIYTAMNVHGQPDLWMHRENLLNPSFGVTLRPPKFGRKLDFWDSRGLIRLMNVESTPESCPPKTMNQFGMHIPDQNMHLEIARKWAGGYHQSRGT